MTNPIRDCTVCGEAFWSVPTESSAPAICPGCSEIANTEEAREAAAPAEVRPRFIALSALPPEKRLPPRRSGAVSAEAPAPAVRPEPMGADGRMIPAPRPSVVGDSRVIAPSLPPAQVSRPAPLPAPPPSPPAVRRDPVPVPSIPAALQQIGFNCPSCFTVLVIKDPSSYDGRAAPCPYCAVTILPPRVVPPSPFTLVAQAPAPAAQTGRLKWTATAQEAVAV